MDKNDMKKAAAKAALNYIDYDTVVGVGTGSTANYFIEYLATIKHKITGAVASSKSTEKMLQDYGIQVIDLNEVDFLPVYVDGADEINVSLQMIKGGGGALTMEKIVSSVARKFICIADQSKKVEIFGAFPLPVEVIPMARSYVARELVKKGGNPIYRSGFLTDHKNVILDVWNLNIMSPRQLEQELNNIAGVVTNGIFALRPADVLLLGTANGVQVTTG